MFESIPDHLPSLCIPRISLDITKEKVIEVLETMQIGCIQRVEFVYHKNPQGEILCKKVFIHFTKWIDQTTRLRVLQGKPVNVVYDCSEPWFWKLSMNKKDAVLSTYLV